jgi:hypothetical protein
VPVAEVRTIDVLATALHPGRILAEFYDGHDLHAVQQKILATRRRDIIERYKHVELPWKSEERSATNFMQPMQILPNTEKSFYELQNVNK